MSDNPAIYFDKTLMKVLGHKFRRKLLAIVDLSNLILAGVEGEANPMIAMDVQQMREDAIQVLDMIDDILTLVSIGMTQDSLNQPSNLNPPDTETLRRFIERLL